MFCKGNYDEGSFSKEVRENERSSIAKTKIDLSTPERAARDNTASTTPLSTSSGSASARRTREIRSRKINQHKQIAEEPAKEEIKPEEEMKVVVEAENIPKQAIPPKQKSPKDQEPKKSKDITSIDQLSGIVIKIFYKTVPGQDLFIIGGDEKFGNWSTTDLVFPLTWTDGHIWTAVKKPISLPKSTKFKFIVSEIDNSITFEKKDDRIFDLSKLNYTLRTSQRLRSKGFTELKNGSVKVELDKDQKLLILTYDWEH
jgi:hypothetical protein